VTFANAISVVALFVALGGAAYAVHQINGRSIARRSIPGNRLARHAVGLAEINRPSLGFLEGPGHASFGAASAQISPSTTVCGSTVARQRIVKLPGFGFIDGYCSDYNGGTPICSFSFHDTAGITLKGTEESAIGGQGVGPFAPNLGRVTVTNGSTIDQGTNAPVQRVLWQIGTTPPPGPLKATSRSLARQSPRLLTAVVTQAHPNSAATACHFQAQALAQGG
jgi:hypothetical protein